MIEPMEFFTRFKNALVLITVLVMQTFALAVQVRRSPGSGGADPRPVRLLRLWTTTMVTPFARSGHFVSGGVRGGWSNYVELWHVRQQDRDLREQIAAIRLQQAAEAEDVIEGRRLQALLGFREHYIASTVTAQVIGTSGSEQSHMVLLDKGSEDGLRPDLPAITPDGIVGKLRDVFPHSAQLLLISDPTAGAGVMLESTRIRGILRGTVSGRLQIGNLTADSRIQPGEKVLTSGGDQVFPRGLPVGVIESIAPDPEHQPYTAITVRPAAKLTQLEEVLVVTGTQAELPEQARKDLETAEARHAEEVEAAKAAQAAAAVAPRGLDLSGTVPPDAAKPEAAPGSEATPTNLVPKVSPFLHPDRYSPGATPSAAELRPGAPGPDQPGARSSDDGRARPPFAGSQDAISGVEKKQAGPSAGTPAPVVRKRPVPASPVVPEDGVGSQPAAGASPNEGAVR